MTTRSVDNDDNIENQIIATVIESFGEGVIASVDVSYDADFLDHDDDVIVVRVVFNGDTASVDKRQLATLSMTLRRRLSQLHEDRFPLVRFESKSDNHGQAA